MPHGGGGRKKMVARRVNNDRHDETVGPWHVRRTGSYGGVSRQAEKGRELRHVDCMRHEQQFDFIADKTGYGLPDCGI